MQCKVPHTTGLHPAGSGHSDLRNRADCPINIISPSRVRGEGITASALFTTSGFSDTSV